ncbi:IclR family transcriptional regulator [Haliea sp. E1-2-M8]|uniref:IclR family transcriptional regulator n=1 Tax=Haliea sp. E1-2-M8 TaxID=3064706 RepID=UPI00272894A1|nr:IclR family transcriptional regulator [Haliea sp. E1-2-M8]MDO8863941.1 IclR family transcriptional regulator [Haliea sp. E1-2-M8]
MKHQSKDRLSAIEKALEILVSFADVDREVGTVEVSNLTGIHKATVSRILATLLDYGMVSQNDETRKYYLGPLAYRLGRSQTGQLINALTAISQPHVDRLRDVVAETVSLEVWVERKTVACYLAESHNPLRVAMGPDDVLPLHAPAGAKAILAFVSHDRVDRLIPEQLPSYTERTITSKAALLSRLVEFNKQGYSIDNQELYSGIYAIGVPIFDRLRKPVAAISVVMPASRISAAREVEIVEQLKLTSRAISKTINSRLPSFPKL